MLKQWVCYKGQFIFADQSVLFPRCLGSHPQAWRARCMRKKMMQIIHYSFPSQQVFAKLSIYGRMIKKTY